MNIVLDTNIVISGLLWHGAPRQVLNLAHQGELTLFTSTVLLAELTDVLQRDKFLSHLQMAEIQPADIVLGYASLAYIIKPVQLQPVIQEDPDDDAVLACAIACQSQYIVSGDKHLLNLGRYQDIAILTAHQLLEKVS